MRRLDLTGSEEDQRDQAQAAFNRALHTGRLSRDILATNWVGHYMFMGFDGHGRATFKHRDTRQYIAHQEG
jgi:hypothetical protein